MPVVGNYPCNLDSPRSASAGQGDVYNLGSAPPATRPQDIEALSDQGQGQAKLGVATLRPVAVAFVQGVPRRTFPSVVSLCHLTRRNQCACLS